MLKRLLAATAGAVVAVAAYQSLGYCRGRRARYHHRYANGQLAGRPERCE